MSKKILIAIVSCLLIFPFVSVSYADDDVEPNLIAWFRLQVSSFVEDSISTMEAKKEELLIQFSEKIQIEKELAEEEILRFKEEQLAWYNKELMEINAAEIVSIPEESQLEEGAPNEALQEGPLDEVPDIVPQEEESSPDPVPQEEQIVETSPDDSPKN